MRVCGWGADFKLNVSSTLADITLKGIQEELLSRVEELGAAQQVPSCDSNIALNVDLVAPGVHPES